MIHSKMNEMQVCGKEDSLPQVVDEERLTNGHTHLVNGALKPQDLSSDSDEPSVDEELPECSVKISANKSSPPVQLQAKPDPYEFPHSPPKQSDQSPVFLEQSSSQDDHEQGPKPPPPTYQEAIKATENHLPLKQLQPPHQLGSNREKTPLSPASRCHSNSAIRLNGCHQSALSLDTASLNTTNMATKSGPSTEKVSDPTKASAQLLAQTGGLISEFYTHSRLHQISTWRTGFSEYVNELHSKRKVAGAASFPGKDRLRKFVAQHSAESQGRKRSALHYKTHSGFLLLVFFFNFVEGC